MSRTKILLSLLLGLGYVISLQAQVTLSNGVTVPKDKFIVFLFGGCCDMSGRTGDNDLTPDPHCWGLPPGKADWLPLKDLMFNNSQGAGPAVPFMDEMVARYPGYYFGVIQWSTSYAGLRYGCATKGFYQKSCGGYIKVMNEAKKWQSKVTIGGLFTMLGVAEAESSDLSYAQSYSADYKMMVDTMRKELGLTAETFPVCMNEQWNSTGNLSLSLPGPKTVWQQQKLIPGMVASVSVISSQGVTIAQSNHHPGHPGFHVLASHWADSLKARHFDFWAKSTTNIAKAKSQATIAGISVSQIGRSIGLTVPVGMHTNVAITRLDGSMVRQASFEGRGTTQRIDGLVPGVYMLEMTGNGRTLNKHILVR